MSKPKLKSCVQFYRLNEGVAMGQEEKKTYMSLYMSSVLW